MPSKPGLSLKKSRSLKKRRGSYHHGDLENALIEAAAGIIQQDGVDALTLREVGIRLGVSRTALYRHFSDKAALLARVALRGFQGLRHALRTALDAALSAGEEPLEEMAGAYVAYAIAHPSHYRVMFGRVLENWARYPDLVTEADGAFALLEGTIVRTQKEGAIAPGDSLPLAQIIWSMVHGIATLGMDGQLTHQRVTGEDLADLARFALRRLKLGLHANGA